MFNLFGKKKEPGGPSPDGAPGTPPRKGLAECEKCLLQLSVLQPSDPDSFPLLNECTRLRE